ncbi:MAG TPA: MerR family transcriptional regulator [Gemmatimonadaceae bacterium]|nr:MerR family transcriptional regulator [Gemmatimonadaceae bacterium]
MSDREALTIQQAARASGLTSHTLRYYERIGLVAPVARAGGGHRRYSAGDLGFIQFLTYLRRTGMPIARMQEYASLLREGDHTRQRRHAILVEHREAVQQQIGELQAHLAAVEAKIRRYEEQAEARLMADG